MGIFAPLITFLTSSAGALLLTGASIIYQQNQTAKARRAAEAARARAEDAAATRNVRISGSNEPLGFNYGLMATHGHPVLVDVTDSLTTNSTGETDNDTADKIFGNLQSFTGDRNETLIVQRSFGYGEIEEAVDLDIDNESGRDAIYSDWHRNYMYYDGSKPSPVGQVNSEHIPATSTFNDLTYATEFYRMNREDPQYGGRPTPYYYIKGRKIRGLTRTGSGTESDPYVYSLTARRFSNNAVEVLFDYMLDTNGVNLTVPELNPDSWYEAMQIAGKVVQAGARVQGKVNGINLTVDPDTDTTTRDIIKFEFNGPIYSDTDHITNISEIMDVIPGAIIFRDATGRIKLSIPDEDKTNAEHSVLTVTDDDLISHITVVQPDNDTRLNEYRVDFLNASKDFVIDSKTVKKDAEVAEDSNLRLNGEAFYNGVSNVYHAEYIADTIIEVSRRNYYSFEMRPEGFLLEPGDVIQLASDIDNLTRYVRIANIRVMPDLNVSVEASEFQIADFSWIDMPDEEIRDPFAFDFTVPAPTNAVYSVGAQSATNFQPIILNWVDPDNSQVNEIIIEASINNPDNWVQIASVSTGINTFTYIPTQSGSYLFRIRSRTFTGRHSQYVNVVNAAGMFEAVMPHPPLSSIEVIRHNENLSTNDPGAPTGDEALGGGWYDPTGEVGTVPDDPDPHWEARGIAARIIGTPIQRTFTFDGIGGDVQTTVTQHFKENDFEFSGTPGSEAVTSPAVAWDKDFAVTGQAVGEGESSPAEPWEKQFTFSGVGQESSTQSEVVEFEFSGTLADGGTAYSDGSTAAQWSLRTYDQGLFLEEDATDVEIRIGNSSGNVVTQGNFDGSKLRYIITELSFDETLNFNSSDVHNESGGWIFHETMLTWLNGFSVITNNYNVIATSTNSGTRGYVRLIPLSDSDELLRSHGLSITLPFLYQLQRNFVNFTSPTGFDEDQLYARSYSNSYPVQTGQLGQMPIAAHTLVRRKPGDTNIPQSISSRYASIYNTLMSGYLSVTPVVADYHEEATGEESDAIDLPVVSGESLTVHIDGVLQPTTTVQVADGVRGATVRIGNVDTSSLPSTYVTSKHYRIESIHCELTTIGSDFLEFEIVLPTGPFSRNISSPVSVIPISIVDYTYTSTQTGVNNLPAFDQGYITAYNQTRSKEVASTVIRDHLYYGIPTQIDFRIGSFGFPILFSTLDSSMTLTQVASAVAAGINAAGITQISATSSGAVLTVTNTSGSWVGTGHDSPLNTDPDSFGMEIEVIERGAEAMSNSELSSSVGLDVQETTIQEGSLGGTGDSNASVSLSIDDVIFQVIQVGSDSTTSIAGEVQTAFNDRTEFLATVTGSTVTVTGTVSGAGDEPDVEVNPGSVDGVSGTLAAATSVIQTGSDSVISGNDTLISLRIDSTSIQSLNVAGMTNTEIAEAIASGFGDRADYTGSSTSNVANVVAVTSGLVGEPRVIITNVGESSAGVAGTLSITQTVNAAGSDQVIGGEDGSISLRIDDVEFQSIDVSGLTLDSINSMVVTAFNNRSEYASDIEDGVIEVLNSSPGDMNTPSIVVTAGSNPDGSASDFVVLVTEINSGEDVVSTDGTAASFTITIGDDVFNGTFTDEVSNNNAAQELSSAINTNFTNYTSTFVGNRAIATSTFDGSSPDIVVTINPGVDPDEAAGTLTVVTVLASPGVADGINYENITWSYYIINQEVRVDDDTIGMGDDNSLNIRRGIIENTQAWDDVSGNSDPNGVTSSSNEIAYFTESFSSSSRPTMAVVQLNMLGAATIFEKATDPVNMSFLLQHSIDGGNTWTDSFFTFSFGVSTSNSSLVYRTAAPISASNTLTLMPSQTYWFRVARLFTSGGSIIAPPADGNYTNFLVNALILEELVAS